MLSEPSKINYKNEGFSDLLCDLAVVSKVSPNTILDYSRFLQKIIHKKLIYYRGAKKQIYISDLDKNGVL